MIPQKESSFRKTWNILMPFLVYFVVHDLAQVLLAILMTLSLNMFGGGYAAYMTANAQTVNGVLNALSIMIGVAAIWPMARMELRTAEDGKAGGDNAFHDTVRSNTVWVMKAGESSGRTICRRTILNYAVLSVFAVCLAMGTNILLLLTGFTESSQTYSEVAARQYGVAFLTGLLIYGLLTPLAEEIVFRGLIYNRMKRYFPIGMSVIVCGVLFGAYHGNLVQAVYGIIMGIAMTYCYEKYGSFAAPVLFHSLANLSVFIVGYDSKRMSDITTPLNCVIFMTISAGSLFYIIKMIREQKNKSYANQIK